VLVHCGKKIVDIIFNQIVLCELPTPSLVFISFLEIINFVILETILDATLSTRMNTNDGVDKISWIISSLEIVNVLIIAFLKNMMVFLDIHI
jgi:hypothetical protein